MKTYERFLRYAALPTMSDEKSKSCPSSAKQLVLARLLAEELTAMGLSGVSVDEHGYVYATLPANTEEKCPAIGFIAHMDTSDAASDGPIHTQIIDYNGGDILLNPEKNLWLRPAEYPYLSDVVGKHVIVTDGTTLLGADDKAGIAEIMTMLEKVIKSGKPHGTVKIGFTPDEEIGRGADLFDVEAFHADYAYTVDGGAIGDVEFENFNAGGADVIIHGISIHPGSAKDKMKNAALIACEYNALLPGNEIPAKTEGYEGFYHLTDISGETEIAHLHYILRDHDRAKFEEKKKKMLACADSINEKYNAGTAEVRVYDSYFNMREKIEPCMYIVRRAEKAMRDLGVEAKNVPVRGGTDGARLSFMGLPCPNLCTGGYNFHSRFEYIAIEDMETISDILCRIVTNLPDDCRTDEQRKESV